MESRNGAAILMATLGVCACGAEQLGRSERALTADVRYFHGGLGAGAALVTGAGGTKVWERRYEPYGVPIGDADFVDEPQGGLGMPVDASTGLADHGARWSVSASARWLTPDPRVKEPLRPLASAPWELSPYAYAGGNPTLYWDPDGRDLRITGSRAKQLATYLSAASGLKVKVGGNGVVTLGSGSGRGSATAASVLKIIVADHQTDVTLEAEASDDGLLVGRPDPGGAAGTYQIDVDDLGALKKVDRYLGRSAAMHEAFEGYLYALDGRSSSHAQQHQSAIAVENLVLKEMGAKYQRGAEYDTGSAADGDQVFVVEFGKFNVEVPFDSKAHGAFYRGVP